MWRDFCDLFPRPFKWLLLIAGGIAAFLWYIFDEDIRPWLRSHVLAAGGAAMNWSLADWIFYGMLFAFASIFVLAAATLLSSWIFARRIPSSLKNTAIESASLIRHWAEPIFAKMTADIAHRLDQRYYQDVPASVFAAVDALRQAQRSGLDAVEKDVNDIAGYCYRYTQVYQVYLSRMPSTVNQSQLLNEMAGLLWSIVKNVDNIRGALRS